MAGGSLALSGVVPAGASPVGTTVHCPADNLQTAIDAAAPDSTLRVDGTCTGNFYIDKDLTLSGPAVLDGIDTTFGATLNVAAGTVVLNNVVIQHGVGIDGLGGGVWNGGQLTLNASTVTNNTASGVGGGVFNFGQLTLNISTVTNNTAGTGGGIYNCGTSLQAYGLCTGAPGRITLDNSIVSNNVASSDGGGIWNDATAIVTLNSSIVSSNTADHDGGGIMNYGTATLNKSTLLHNSSTGGSAGWAGGGGLSSTDTSTTTLNTCLVVANTATWLGGGIFAGGSMTINKSVVTGNAAGPEGGGIVAWNGPTTIANSVFWNNTDQGSGPDNPAGVWVAPTNFGGFFINSPTFTTTHSTYS